ncbi:MAG: EAL domain-containing protein (putative c-di-GMP-specific phosphodiesterase class I), partial [Myxococcota bacterium]
PMTVSLGVSRVPAETQSIQEVLAACHAALERSKGAGKNRVSFGSTHDPRLHLAEPADEESRLVDESFYSAVLQPIRQLKTGQILGFEALVRARDAALARPTELFRAARMHRLQTAVDLRSLKAGALVAAETTGTVHLNLLPGTLLETPTEQILELLPSSLRGRVVLELSEQQLVGDPSKLCEPMKHLREAGVRFALDDVGFGKSSLEALIVLEPEVVKLARRCVTGVANRTDGRRTLSRLVKVIRALGAEIIAVGVESRRDVEVLLELDVSSAQGFLWDPPEDPPAL